MPRTVVAETALSDGRAVLLVDAADVEACVIRDIVVDAFSHRPPVDPPPAALAETPGRIAEAVRAGFGVVAFVEDEPAGVVLVSLEGDVAGIHRVSVRPRFQRAGVAAAMMAVVGDLLAVHGVAEARLVARAELPDTVAWWQRHGFTAYARNGVEIHLRHPIAVRVQAKTADATRDLGVRLAALLRRGDLLIASGELGAGKTTLAQGIGAGLGVAGAVLSPTFVLSRVHPSPTGGPTFVHVDAYRLGGFAELEDLDLEASLDDSVTYVEWGEGMAEALASDRLEIDIRRGLDPADETRWVFLMPVGERWLAARGELEALRGQR